jgi:hypothetical protein
LPTAMLARFVIERRQCYRMGLVGLLFLTCVCASPKIGPSDWTWWRWLFQGKDFWGAIVIVTLCAWCGTPRVNSTASHEDLRALAA